MSKNDLTLYQRAKNFLMRRTNYETFESLPYDQMELSLDRVRRFLEFLGNPDRQYVIVHVAGTKGKGTTCAALDQIYRAAGYRVGLFTSPHLDQFLERFQIDGKICDKTFFAETTWALAGLWKDFVRQEKLDAQSSSDSHLAQQELPEELTFFEWTLVLAVTLFARAKVDIAILEVGLGGRFDATNACDADVSVLTSVSYDHCEQLGYTLSEIASEKLGIVKTNAPLVCGVGFSGALYSGFQNYLQRNSAQMSVETQLNVRQGAGQMKDPSPESFDSVSADAPTPTIPKAPLFRVGDGVTVKDFAYAVEPETIISVSEIDVLRSMAHKRAVAFNSPFVSVESISPRVAALPTPPFDSVRRWNFEVALRVVEILATRRCAPERRPGADDPNRTRRFPVPPAAISAAAANFSIPARFEIVSKSPLVIVDGAHNRASIAAFVQEVAERYPGKKVRTLVAFTTGKDIKGMLAELAARVDEIHLSERPKDPRALPLPELIQIAENLMDEVCPEDSPIRRKFHVAPDFRAFLADYCARMANEDGVMCALGSFYFAALVRQAMRKHE
jgi:folylpolyglutamate synthase/dihydropteroate synthase